MLSSGNHDSELQKYDSRFSNKHSEEEVLACSHIDSSNHSPDVCTTQ